MKFAALAGILAFATIFGFHILDPSYIDWLMVGDAGVHYTGWSFFRNAPWSFPLGDIPNLIYPIGTSIAHQDSIPLIALPLKFFSSWLPADFQYFGFWILICFILQAISGYCLIFAMTEKKGISYVGSLFFLMSPHFLFREERMMTALASHWLILFAFSVCVSKKNPNDKFLKLTLLNFLAVYIHPYLAFMIFFISIWTLAFSRDLRPKNRAGFALLLSAIVGLLFCSLGYFDTVNFEAVGFGVFSADLLTYLNPFNRGMLPALPSQREQLEGMAYLGLGMIGAGLISLVAMKKVWRDLPREFLWLGILCFLFFIFSLSSVITIAGSQIADLSSFYQLLGPIPGVLRASGRLAGPLHYWIFATAITAVSQRWPKHALAVLIFLFAVQIIDLGRWLSTRPAWVTDWQWNKAVSPKWSEIVKNKKIIFLVPMRFEYINCYGLPVQSAGFDDFEYYSFANLAAKNNMAINSGLDARGDVEAIAQECNDLPGLFKNGKLEEDTLFIIHPDYFKKVQSDAGDKIKCESHDGFHACFARPYFR